jgi:hypothetical protein
MHARARVDDAAALHAHGGRASVAGQQSRCAVTWVEDQVTECLVMHDETSRHNEYVDLCGIEDVGKSSQRRRWLGGGHDHAGRQPEPGQLLTDAAGVARLRDDGTDHSSRPRPASSL